MDTGRELRQARQTSAARPAQRWTGWAMLLLAVIAAIGWGAYLFETSRKPLYGDARGVPATTEPVSPAAAKDAVPARASAPAVSGTWMLTTQVESASVERFSGLRLGYELELQQDGTRVTGTGRKVSENGQPLDARGQTPITVEGTLDDTRLHLHFVERGAQRLSAGHFDLRMEGGLLRGHFTSDAADSGGTVEARRRFAAR